MAKFEVHIPFSYVGNFVKTVEAESEEAVIANLEEWSSMGMIEEGFFEAVFDGTELDIDDADITELDDEETTTNDHE